MSLQRPARIQGHSIRVLDEIYSEQLQEYEDAETAIDPVVEIRNARELVWKGPGFASGMTCTRRCAELRVGSARGGGGAESRSQGRLLSVRTLSFSMPALLPNSDFGSWPPPVSGCTGTYPG
jgi:hypothetical protein